ncbi:hypothetical protein M408DRAFT_19950 [Serendipita vermifera MAFF 305830]|uniref:F-box domain-containing protein n=1 Tax=Serendipita vermifera MAFF 305830 TaxID=933852 RepID=A0A0C3BM89_SERVB|nr:hypothetical protein M408DRAFT_19950 [Serendipita vermifera MAFF 305830]
MFLQSMTAHSISSDPPEIRRKLEALQHQHEVIENLRSRINVAQLECARLETELSEYRASVAPIRRCPQELLLMFFEYHTCKNPRLIRNVLLVCKQWYELAISSPRLWNRIPINFDSDWDLKSACESIEKRLEQCLKFSGTLPLELDFDFSELIPPQNQIESKIWEDISKYIQEDGFRAFDTWVSDLNVDLLNDPAVISICQPHHIFGLLKILMGKDGGIMSRWGTLRVELPDDSELALDILELFSYATPSLVRLQIKYMRAEYASILGGEFPDLSALEHLEVSSAADLKLFKSNPTLMQTLTFLDMQSCDPSILTPFTRLQELEVICWVADRLEEDSFSHGVVDLPALRRLSVRGVVPNFGTLKFRVPVLDELHLSRGYIENPFIYPKVQASRISWEVERGWSWISKWTLDRVRLDLRAILLQYRSATELRLSSRWKEGILALVQELKSDGTWLSALRVINLEAEDGTISETIEVQEL